MRSCDQMSGEAVDAYIDDLHCAGIGTFFSCVNAMRANYASQVWETDWHGYDPDGPDDQPVLRCLPAKAIPPTRRRLDAAKRLADLGINFHERALARCRNHGIGAWVTVRLNDVHDCMVEDSSLLSTFYKAQRAAKQLRAPHGGRWWAEMGLDWERLEVQEHFLKLVREQLETLDLDGIELDWMRFVFHFRAGRELAGGQAITAWTRRVQALCREAAQRWGTSNQTRGACPHEARDGASAGTRCGGVGARGLGGSRGADAVLVHQRFRHSGQRMAAPARRHRRPARPRSRGALSARAERSGVQPVGGTRDRPGSNLPARGGRIRCIFSTIFRTVMGW